MDDQYCGFGNLRRLMDDDHFSDHGASAALMHHLMGGDVDSVSGPKPEALPLPPPPSMAGDLLGDNGISGYRQGRWPRQETLTLLEIRSRLDPKFKESAHKAPLWDEVSRIMAEENGYQRSGKKCREKIENLYKYYKKTKEGKAGRQDGRHYRFFRQLEALYGESSNAGSNLGTEIAVAGDIAGNVEKTQFHFRVLNNTNPSTKTSTARATSDDPEAPNQDGCDLYKSLGLSSSSDDELGVSDDSSRDENDNKGNSSPRIKWESKIKDFVDQQVKKFMEVQEAWLEKMLKSLEKNEQERISREEQWRKKETARLHREQEQWANERAWIEARDLALVEVLGKVISTGAGRDQLTTIVRKRNRNDQKKRKGMSTVGSSSSCFDHLEDDGDDDDGIDEEEEEDRKVGTSRHSGLGTGVVVCDDDDDDGCFRFLIERLR